MVYNSIIAKQVRDRNLYTEGILAQLGEHLPYKQRVIGSSPIGPIYGWIPEWPKGTDCKSAANCFGGSNPPPSIKVKVDFKFGSTSIQLDKFIIHN